MSLMGSRSACRLASQYSRRMGNQRAAGGDGWRLMMSRWLASASSSSNATATRPKVPKPQQPTVVASQGSQTHTSAVLVPPQQTDGTKVAVKLEEEYPCDVAPVEIPTKNDLQQPLSESDQSDEAHFASRIEAFKMAENESASAASSNLGRGERQAHTTTSARKNSVDKKETAKFAAIAATWWDPKGPYKPLHIMNPTRVSYVRSSICKHFRKDANTARPLEGLKIIDVGCGGGLVCEPLARMGAEVTGVDAVEKNIGVASIHAARDPTTASIKYMCTTAEQLVWEEQKFDVVLALEVIEHVADPEDFCKSLAALAKKDGLVFISTLNRSLPSFGLAIVAAEYILGWLPKGTHEWSKFLTPEELSTIMDRSSIAVKDTSGMVYNPLTQRWSISGTNTTVNYIAYGVNQSA